MKIQTHPFPILTTSRLQLRQLLLKDEELVFAMRSDENNGKFLDRPKTQIIQDARDFITKIIKGINENKWFYWTITLAGEDKLIGTICLWNFSEDSLNAEIGYELLPDFKGKGYMQEASWSVIDYAFQELKLTKLNACTHQKNLASIRLLQKNNFIFKGQLKKSKGMVLYTLEA